ncbi:ATP-binding cassette domain-containing protein [Desulfosporosinus lacus]|uniref:ABC-2 type transport system ATP-binding protein n=1 Tax=Desulfosporosinus lacus DSM 15449 TaxID=1121420 RepID=A0A1M5S7F7_9FIRM|nr:ATP-binding cassette domain-containing protein [Desulfosporosinus lacus]SHH34434.1 ABC-2 type transport system ATP-binding protein [Desulfosporosinus lacus DSM 15449]
MTKNELILKEVTKKFKNTTVLNKVSVSFEAGKIHGIIGRNGSGKTVLFKCICGFMPITSGQILVDGNQIDVPQNIGIIIEAPGFLPNYSGYRNLKLLSLIRHQIDDARIKETMKKVGLDPDNKKRVNKYSLGMRQRLGIAQAIMEDPSVLILDEPMNGLDKHGVEDIRHLILNLKAEGKTILIASHSSEDIAKLCDTVYEMDAGVLTPLLTKKASCKGYRISRNIYEERMPFNKTALSL